METYHRKRSKNAIKPLASTEEMMIRMRRQLESSSISDGAKAPPHLARVPAAALVQQQSHSHCTPTSLHTNDDESSDQHDIEVGSVYEIDHTNLPPRTPVHLRSIRVVMVSEKTELNVSVRFPSNESLRTYFSDRIREMYPALDEKFVMGIKLAGKVLFRQVPSQEFAEKKHSEGFWLVNQSYVGGFGNIVATRKDMGLTTELKSNGMVRWGIRRQVMFLGKHSESINPDLSNSSSFVKGISEAKEGEVKKIQVENDGNEEEEDEEEEEEDEKVNKKTHEVNLKRKRYSFRNTVQKAKRVKREKQQHVHKATTKKKTKNRCKQIVLRDPTDRWSKERYKLAEKNLLDIMKEKGAVIGHPILRPALRLEARKRIGDTGLLDHLLKHMAGKVAPGGEERFRRRHNAAGAMEYWLESADLAKIRVEAGVEDPFWVPPPGWKPGDCPTQDPICANELKLLKEETYNIKEKIEEMVSKKKFEEELAKLKREMEEIASKKYQEETQAIVVSEDPGLICSKMNLSTTTFVPSETELDNDVPREKYKQQLMHISDFLKKIEAWVHGEMGKVKSLLEGAETKSGSELIVSGTTTAEPCAEKEMVRQAAEKSKEVILLKEDDELEGRERNSQQGSADQKQANSEKAAAAEEKAAKIQRLKSGFRICKPQGTFLWPSMVNNPNSNNPTTSTNNSTVSPQVVVQVEDLFLVRTPPSVSSSTATAPPQLPYHPHQHNPASPVKPLAERRALTVTVYSTISKGPPQSYDDGGNNYTTTTTTTTDGNKTTTLINLNDIPTGHPNEGFYVNPSAQQTITTTTVMPSLMPSTEVKGERMSSGCRPWEMYGNGGCGSTSR